MYGTLCTFYFSFHHVVVLGCHCWGKQGLILITFALQWQCGLTMTLTEKWLMMYNTIPYIYQNILFFGMTRIRQMHYNTFKWNLLAWVNIKTNSNLGPFKTHLQKQNECRQWLNYHQHNHIWISHFCIILNRKVNHLNAYVFKVPLILLQSNNSRHFADILKDHLNIICRVMLKLYLYDTFWNGNNFQHVITAKSLCNGC